MGIITIEDVIEEVRRGRGKAGCGHHHKFTIEDVIEVVRRGWSWASEPLSRYGAGQGWVKAGHGHQSKRGRD